MRHHNLKRTKKRGKTCFCDSWLGYLRNAFRVFGLFILKPMAGLLFDALIPRSGAKALAAVPPAFGGLAQQGTRLGVVSNQTTVGAYVVGIR